MTFRSDAAGRHGGQWWRIPAGPIVHEVAMFQRILAAVDDSAPAFLREADAGGHGLGRATLPGSTGLSMLRRCPAVGG